MSYYLPHIFFNGERLTNVKIKESRDAGAWVSAVYIEAPDFEIQKKDDE